MENRPAPDAPVPARLALWDTISILVGIMVGVGIYQAPPAVFRGVSSPEAALGVWLLGGVLSLAGALCFAELASTYPHSGGEFLYLTRAYGSGVGFLFAWAQLAIIRTGGSIAAPAYVFAVTASQLADLGGDGTVPVAFAVIAVLSLLNILGTEPGKWVQNGLTLAKVLSLAGIIAAGLLCPRADPVPVKVVTETSFAVAMVLVLYAFDGWNEAAYVAAEVRHSRRNLPLALLLGTLGVTVIYLLVNLAYLVGLGFEGARDSRAGAGDLLELALGSQGAWIVSVLVLISILGSLNGTILTGSRLFAALGAHHAVFTPLAWWSPRQGTPVVALLVQGVISISMVLLVGLRRTEQQFERLVAGTAPVFWLFLALTGAALFVLRWKDPQAERTFRVPLYPLTPLVFCGWSGYMLVGSTLASPKAALLGAAILLTGLPLYLVSGRLARRQGPRIP